jgi:Ca-activated chloride channel family protein
MKAAGPVQVQRGARFEQAKVVQNPSFYVSNTYMGGHGSKERLEKLISEGVFVQGKRVKLEAFSRSYGQSLPIPTNQALGVSALAERSKVVEEGGVTYLQVGLQAMKGEAPRRPPLNVALVLDVSGSMEAENKLVDAKAAAQHLVGRLTPQDTLSVVTFDDTANVLVPAGRVTNPRQAIGRIRGLTPGSGTNIFDGLRLGYKELAKNASGDRVSRLVLISDGQVSAGITDQQAFEKLAAREVENDVQTTAVGLGVDFNEDLMLAVAREGKGTYHFIKDGGDTRKVFDQELDELTNAVARAVRLRIKLAEGVGLVRVLGAARLDETAAKKVKAEERAVDRKVAEELGISTDRQRIKDEPGIKLLIPSFYRGDSHVVMLELSVPRGRGQRKLADVELKYKDLVRRANGLQTASCAVTYTPNRQEMIASINRGVKKNLLGFQTGEALQTAAALVEQGRVAEAVKRVDERMVVLGAAAREWRDRDLDHDGMLLDRYKSVLAQLRDNPGAVDDSFGQYLRKSLTYSGYALTR